MIYFIIGVVMAVMLLISDIVTCTDDTYHITVHTLMIFLMVSIFGGMILLICVIFWMVSVCCAIIDSIVKYVCNLDITINIK